ncbi:FtsW/RodA/SpoVE family cell cycle protein [Candidatus Nesciobacter abundans]|uniref:Rod shape-determining protein RodA n=1 Tax=Candidatus Nesciobacter abundans TaxID=2601668 RepID=A0A5C0UHQ3_9PROT|nr:FtsW/RodA/SpoVE family cell cycle protein [Candidatus Nesciobacter abundans]QEK39083.1 rod shape-determining protein RodA [Candidatus Nesciobacter abundans]
MNARIFRNEHRFKIFNTKLPIYASLLQVIGFFALWSMSENKKALSHLVRLIAMIPISYLIRKVRPSLIFSFSDFFYFICVLLLLFTFLYSKKHMGAYRWLNLFFIKIQTSDLMKVGVLLYLSKFLHISSSSFKSFAYVLCIVFIPFFFVMKQPDLGTSLIILVTAICMIYMHNFWWFLSIFLSGVSFVPFVWKFLHSYQKNRIMAFLNPSLDTKGIGYHSNQSIISIGSGGFWGKGVGKSTQSTMGFLPEKHTDFIISHIAEELGLIGIFIIILLFFLILLEIYKLIKNVKIKYYRMLLIGISSYILFQAYMNIAMSVGLCPVVGITLPFTSYGGSSLLSIWICIGLVENIASNQNYVLPGSDFYKT